MPPDPDFLVQGIERAHYQACAWFQWVHNIAASLNLEEYEWWIHYEDIMPVWFCENQLPPAVGKRHPKKPRDGNMEDIDGTNINSKETPTKKPRLKMATVKKVAKTTTI